MRHAWWLVLLGALGFLTCTTHLRLTRVTYLSNLVSWSVDAPVPDAQSPTGYASGQRRLIVHGHHNPSYQWIMQTQQMLVDGSLRIRHVDYDNAPSGRDTHATAPYRWWLALVAWFGHLVTPAEAGLGLAVERGALYADPILHALLVLSATLFAARFFGSLAASLVALATVALFPLADGFQPGAPDVHSLAWLCGLWSVLPLLAAVRLRRRAASRASEANSNSKGRLTFTPHSVLNGVVVEAVRPCSRCASNWSHWPSR